MAKLILPCGLTPLAKIFIECVNTGKPIGRRGDPARPDQVKRVSLLVKGGFFAIPKKTSHPSLQPESKRPKKAHDFIRNLLATPSSTNTIAGVPQRERHKL